MKTFMIIVHTPTGSVEHTHHSIAHALMIHQPVLFAGDDAHVKGKNKIHTTPRSAKVLVDNLNKAMANLSPNGYSSTIYELDTF